MEKISKSIDGNCPGKRKKKDLGKGPAAVQRKPFPWTFAHNHHVGESLERSSDMQVSDFLMNLGLRA